MNRSEQLDFVIDLMNKENGVTTSVLARCFKVQPHLVRYYTRIGLLKPSRDPSSGYKLYGEDDLVRLRFVLLAKDLGFTLDEIKQVLQESEQGKSPCLMVRGIVKRHVEANRRKIEDLQLLQGRLESALQKWETMPDAAPHKTSVCHLVESTAPLENLLDLSLAHTFRLLL